MMTDWMQASLAYAKSAAGRRRSSRALQPVTMAGNPPDPVAEYIDLLAAGRRWFWYPVKPVAKPRMTRRDKWLRRPCVADYRQYKDCCRDVRMTIPDNGGTVIFCLPMPKSWSAKRKREYEAQRHEQTPDIDNLLKGLLDAVRREDKTVSGISTHKIWSSIAGMAVIWPQPADNIEEIARMAREVC